MNKNWARLMLAAGLALLIVIGPASTAAPTVPPGGAPAAVDGPNIVLVLVDDADAKTLAYLPRTTSLVADQGATLDQYLYNQATCCPSRATMLRGQYSQNTGVAGNNPPEGGYSAFFDRGNEASTVATWFDDAGYATAYLGKYLNGYAAEAGLPDTHVPVGWDRWFGLFHDDVGTGYFDYVVNKDGVLTTRGSTPKDYVTDVLADEARRFLESDLAAGPFFLQVSMRAPHGPATPAERHQGLFSDVKYPKTPAFNEAHVSDKPGPIADRRKLSAKEKRKINRDYRDRLRSMQAVDEMVADLVETLADQERLENTYVVFASDNGFHMGEHRLSSGKNTPYEEDLRVPLFIRGPGIAPGQQIDQLIGNVDLAPTLAEAAGVVAPDFVDGRSFLPIVRGEDVPWRNSYLLGRGGPRGDGFAGVRTKRYTYLEYESGEREFYDLVTDPYQLHNTYDTMPADLRVALHTRVKALRTCRAEACRATEAEPLLIPAPMSVARTGAGQLNGGRGGL